MLGGGVIRAGRGDALPDRLMAIDQALAAVVEEFQPSVMAVEDLFNAKNARSSLILGHARGVILLCGARAGLQVFEYAPREVKKALVGSGAATKEQVRFMVMRLLQLKKEPPLDMSDALGVALAHQGRSASGSGRKGLG